MANNKGWAAIVCILLCILGAILLLISVFCFDSAQKGMENIKDNVDKKFDVWSSDLVFDITSNPARPLGADEYLVPWQGYFPGTKAGCYCSLGSLSVDGLSAGLNTRECSGRSLYQNCVNIPPQSPQPLTKYIANQVFYAVKIKGTSFLQTYSKINTDGTCQAGFKHCGNPASISKGVCIPATVPTCPLTNILPSNSGSDTELKVGAFSFWINRDEKENPISDVNITESHLCTVRTDYPITANRKRYPLLLGYSENCKMDTLAAKLPYVLGEKDFFDQNGVNYKDLKDYDVSNSYQYYMIAGRSTEWSPNCAKEVPGLVSGSKKGADLNSQYSTLWWLFIASFVVFFCACAAIIAMFAASSSSSSGPNKICICLAAVLVLISVFLIFPSFCIVMSNSSALASDLEGFASKKCSNEVTNNYYTQLNKDFQDKVKSMTNGFFWVGMAAFLLLIAGSVFGFIEAFCSSDSGSSESHLPNRPGPYTQLGDLQGHGSGNHANQGNHTNYGNYGYQNPSPAIPSPGSWSPHQYSPQQGNAGAGAYGYNNYNQGPSLIVPGTKPQMYK